MATRTGGFLASGEGSLQASTRWRKIVKADLPHFSRFHSTDSRSEGDQVGSLRLSRTGRTHRFNANLGQTLFGTAAHFRLQTIDHPLHSTKVARWLL